MYVPLTLHLSLCIQAMIEGGVNATTMWAHAWEACARPNPNTDPSTPQTVDAQAHECPTQIKVPMTQRFHVDSIQVRRFIYLKLAFIAILFIL